MFEIDAPAVSIMSFSPLATFLVTWRKIQEKGQGERNLQVWHIPTKAVVLELSLKSVSREQWPPVKFNDT